MQFIQIEPKHKHQYERFVNNNTMATCMQMWEWAEFRNRLWTDSHNRVGVVDKDNTFHLTATYAINKFKFLGNILYIPQGPIWDDPKALNIFSKEIKKVAKQNNCIAIICEPRVKLDSESYKELISAGFTFSNKAVQPRVTVFLDLANDNLLNSFSKSTRYNVKYAARKEIEIAKYSSPSDIAHIQDFHELIVETRERKYFYVQPLEYFENLWKEFSTNNHATLYEAKFEDELLGAILVLNNNVWASSLFSASNRKHSNLKPMYLARWESIRGALAKGCKIYDFFGATNSKDENHPFFHTTKHKLGFSKKLEEFAGTFEIITNPVKYTLWKKIESLGLIKFYEQTFVKEFKRKN
jgi:lipid II:glycine glycyltransferase (peptidoglycan interpeptide bridge formation enzyme)